MIVKKSFSGLSVILLVALIAVIAGGAYYLGAKYSLKQINISPQPTQPTQKKLDEPLFSGSVKKISKDLGLFKITDIDTQNGVSDSIVYYEAGVFTTGEFKDYTRILAIRPSEGPGPSLQYVLATKDYQTYLLDDPNGKTTKYPETDWDNPYLYINKNKITKAVRLDTEHPKIIELEKPFGLIQEGSVLTEYKKTNQKDKNGNDMYLEEPITEFDKSQSLKSPEKQLTFYAGGTDWGTGEGYSDGEKKLHEIRKKYLHSTTLVHVQDSTGLAYSYILTTQKDIDTYLNKFSSNEQDLIAYKKQVALFNEKKLKEYPTSPQFLSLPGMKISKPLSGFYETYESAFPGACGGSQSTFIVDSINEEDLELVISSSAYPLYFLKDNNHPLYKLAYQTKVDIDEETYKSVNDGKTKPTYQEYIAKYPLLFFKDAWGRWGVMGEFDIKLTGGCGKPVIYLYPEQPTDIHVSFATQVNLATQIPFYHNGWFVNASPDGTLTDLQPQYTDCKKINSLKFGSEYGQEACHNNTYPYLFWSGKMVENAYPKVSEGWIIRQEELFSFLENKLREIGLNEKETNDMVSYWGPMIMQQKSPYLKLNFVLTRDMNSFIPMKINPNPDSILRVFLNFERLDSKPNVDPKPQKFDKFIRHGFTLIEWGGNHR